MNQHARKIVNFANRRLTVKSAAMILISSMLVSSLLGLFRNRLLNSYYLDTYPTGIDAYTVAFIIPDFMFSILVAGALTVTFLPVFNQVRNGPNKKNNQNNEQAWELTSSIINLMSLVTLGISIFIMIFAEPLIKYVVGPGLDEASRALAASMMRVIAINPFLFSISGITASLQQAYGRYMFYALAPAVYNIGIIVGVLFFTNGIRIFGYEIFEGGIMGVALGVVFGSILQTIISAIGIMGLGFKYKFKIFWGNQGFLQVLRIFPARSLSQGASYVNNVIETRLASRMMSGTITSYNQAVTLHMMPINLIGVAISNAAFASMTEKLALGKKKQFKKEVQSIFKTIIWISLPIATMSYLTRGYLVHFIKNGGDTLIASLFGGLAVAIFFRSIYHILARTFYAQQNTKTPFIISLIAIASNISLAVYFTSVLNTGAQGLAWSQSIAACIEVCLLLFVLRKEIAGFVDKNFGLSVLKMFISSFGMAMICYYLVRVFPLRSVDQSFLSIFPKFCLIGAISSLSYLLFSKLFKLEQAVDVINQTQRIFFPKPKNGSSK